MDTDKETPRAGFFLDLFAAAIAAALISAAVTYAVYNLWTRVILPDLDGKQWFWLLEMPGPWDSRWWNVWLWATGIVMIMSVPRIIVRSVKRRRRR